MEELTQHSRSPLCWNGRQPGSPKVREPQSGTVEECLPTAGQRSTSGRSNCHSFLCVMQQILHSAITVTCSEDCHHREDGQHREAKKTKKYKMVSWNMFIFVELKNGVNFCLPVITDSKLVRCLVRGTSAPGWDANMPRFLLCHKGMAVLWFQGHNDAASWMIILSWQQFILPQCVYHWALDTLQTGEAGPSVLKFTRWWSPQRRTKYGGDSKGHLQMRQMESTLHSSNSPSCLDAHHVIQNKLLLCKRILYSTARFIVKHEDPTEI